MASRAKVLQNTHPTPRKIAKPGTERLLVFKISGMETRSAGILGRVSGQCEKLGLKVGVGTGRNNAGRTPTSQTV